jgi:release factor glutamine methyltransferase
MESLEKNRVLLQEGQRAPSLERMRYALMARLREGRVENPGLEARVLIKHALKCEDMDIVRDLHKSLSDHDIQTLNISITRRLSGEPLARIVGSREFWSLNFEVTPATLIPRPDTETLIDAVLDYCRVHGINRPYSLLDLGTGTGCILISLLTELPQAHGVGIDCSRAALEVARRNSQCHSVEARACFLEGNWLLGIDDPFDIIVSNPPYIATGDISGLDRCVRDYDPVLALDGGSDGLEAYRSILARLSSVLTDKGCAFLEIGINQMCAIEELLPATCLKKQSVYKDLAGKERVVSVSRA